jgi:hypothetical protein
MKKESFFLKTLPKHLPMVSLGFTLPGRCVKQRCDTRRSDKQRKNYEHSYKAHAEDLFSFMVTQSKLITSASMNSSPNTHLQSSLSGKKDWRLSKFWGFILLTGFHCHVRVHLALSNHCAGINAFSMHWRYAFEVRVAPLTVSTWSDWALMTRS